MAEIRQIVGRIDRIDRIGLAFGYSPFLPGADGCTVPASQVATIGARRGPAALHGGPLVTAVTPVIAYATAPDWSPTGDQLAYTSFTNMPSPAKCRRLADDGQGTYSCSSVSAFVADVGSSNRPGRIVWSSSARRRVGRAP